MIRRLLLLTLTVMVGLGLGLPLCPARAADLFPAVRGHLDNDVLYYITVDRFYDGDPSNNIPTAAFPLEGDLDAPTLAYNRANQALLPHLYDGSHRYVNLYWGGDLAGVLQKLDYLQDLGVTKLVLSGIQDSANSLLYNPGSNGYLYDQVKINQNGADPFYSQASAGFNQVWLKDWFELDEHLRDLTGDQRQPKNRFQILRRLLDEAGDRGMGILLELNLNSTSPYRTDLDYKPFDPHQSERWGMDNGAVYRHGDRVAEYISLTASNSSTDSSTDSGTDSGTDSSTAIDPNAPPSPLINPLINPQGWFHEPIPLDYNRPTATMLEQAPINGLPDLNQENPQVAAYLLEAVRFWLNFNPQGVPIAGFYLPSIPNINVEFWQNLEQTVQEVRPDALLVAAYGDGGYRKAASVDWYEKTQDYSLVNYSFSTALRRFFGQDRGWDGRTAVLRESILGKAGRYYNYGSVQRLIHWILNPSESLEIPRHALDVVSEADAKGWVNFVDSPEQPRILSYYPAMTNQAYGSALKFMFASEGVPLLLYGDEAGLAVPHHPQHSGPFGIGGYPFNQQMMIWPGDGGWNDRLHTMTRSLVQLRRDYPVLRYGDTRFLFPANAQADKDLFMVREFEHCTQSPQECPDASRILYAYSTEGGNFLLNFDETQVSSVKDTDLDDPYPVLQGLVPLHLQPEEAKVLVLQSPSP